MCLYECGELALARRVPRAPAPSRLATWARVALYSSASTAPAVVRACAASRPRRADALHAVGLAYLAKGDGKAARRYLEAFLGANPEFEVRVEVEAVLDRLAQEGL